MFFTTTILLTFLTSVIAQEQTNLAKEYIRYANSEIAISACHRLRPVIHHYCTLLEQVNQKNEPVCRALEETFKALQGEYHIARESFKNDQGLILHNLYEDLQAYDSEIKTTPELFNQQGQLTTDAQIALNECGQLLSMTLPGELRAFLDGSTTTQSPKKSKLSLGAQKIVDAQKRGISLTCKKESLSLLFAAVQDSIFSIFLPDSMQGIDHSADRIEIPTLQALRKKSESVLRELQEAREWQKRDIDELEFVTTGLQVIIESYGSNVSTLNLPQALDASIQFSQKQNRQDRLTSLTERIDYLNKCLDVCIDDTLNVENPGFNLDFAIEEIFGSTTHPRFSSGKLDAYKKFFHANIKVKTNCIEAYLGVVTAWMKIFDEPRTKNKILLSIYDEADALDRLYKRIYAYNDKLEQVSTRIWQTRKTTALTQELKWLDGIIEDTLAAVRRLDKLVVRYLETQNG